MSDGDSQIDVRGDDRVVLHKRAGQKKGHWHIRIRVPGAKGYKRFSSKTLDQKEAEHRAIDAYEELYLHVKRGGSLNSKTFSQVFSEWKKSIAGQTATRHGNSWDVTIQRIESYAAVYFGPRKIDEIDGKVFATYWQWRRSNYKKRPPSDDTLRREKTCLTPVFDYALSKGYISEKPNAQSPKPQKNRRRPTFSPDEWGAISRNAYKWLADAKGTVAERDRFFAYQSFFILANTGLRVGELRNLTWSNLRTMKTKDGSFLVASVKGKTGSRDAVFQPESDVFVERLRERRTQELGRAPPKSELVVCSKDGQPIKSMKKSFNSMLSFCGVPVERDGGARTPYSLRHFYATQRLSNDISPFLLAKQMGTSVEMLEKHYGQTVTASLAQQITKVGKK